jgi:hypothetical protein
MAVGPSTLHCLILSLREQARSHRDSSHSQNVWTPPKPVGACLQAMAAGQSHVCYLTNRHREQARSHRGSSHPQNVWTPPKPVGACLQAMAAGQSVSFSSDTPLSRAGSLLQVCVSFTDAVYAANLCGSEPAREYGRSGAKKTAPSGAVRLSHFSCYLRASAHDFSSSL